MTQNPAPASRNLAISDNSQIYCNLSKNSLLPGFYGMIGRVLIQTKNMLSNTICETMGTVWNERSFSALQNCTNHAAEFIASPETLSTLKTTATNFSTSGLCLRLGIWGFIAQATQYAFISRYPNMNKNLTRGVGWTLATIPLVTFSLICGENIQEIGEVAFYALGSGLVCTKVAIPLMQQTLRGVGFIFNSTREALNFFKWNTEAVSFSKSSSKVVVVSTPSAQMKIPNATQLNIIQNTSTEKPVER